LPNPCPDYQSIRRGRWEQLFALSNKSASLVFTKSPAVDVGDNGTGIDNISFTTLPVNNPPAFNPSIGDKEVSENETLTFTIAASDLDGNNLTYEHSSLPSGALFDTSTRTFSWTPTYDQAGSYSITFTVVDDGSPPASVSETIIITVGDVNRPPALAEIGDKTIFPDTPLVFQISASDPDDNNLSYTASNLPEGAIFDPNTQYFSWTPYYEQAGSHSISFTVSDDGNPKLSDSKTITINVGNANAPPKLAVIGNKDITENETLTFVVTATDANNKDVLTFSAENLPPGAIFNSNNQTVSWTPDYSQAGQYQVTFKVTDNGTPPKSDQKDIWIYVGNVNRYPVLASIGNKTAYCGVPLKFTISANDPDGDALIYSASNLPSGASFNPTTQEFNWTPGLTDQGGTYTVSFKVADIVPNGSLEAGETITIKVNSFVQVTIDIKPGDYPNSINLGSGGVTPVAILSSPGFDATQVDPLTIFLANAKVKLRGKGTPMASKTDVNGDGLLDLLVHVDTSAMSLSDLGDNQATLWGRTYGGIYIQGFDSIKIVPPGK